MHKNIDIREIDDIIKDLKQYKKILISLGNNSDYITHLKYFRNRNVKDQLIKVVNTILNNRILNFEVKVNHNNVDIFELILFFEHKNVLKNYGIVKEYNGLYIEDYLKTVKCIKFKPDMVWSGGKKFKICVKENGNETKKLLIQYYKINIIDLNDHKRELFVHHLLNFLKNGVFENKVSLKICDNFVFSYKILTNKKKDKYYNLIEYIKKSARVFLKEENSGERLICFMIQILYAIYCSKHILGFNHNDLFIRNIRIQTIEDKDFDGLHFIFDTQTVFRFSKNCNFIVKIIDFGMSAIDFKPYYYKTRGKERTYLIDTLKKVQIYFGKKLMYTQQDYIDKLQMIALFYEAYKNKKNATWSNELDTYMKSISDLLQDARGYKYFRIHEGDDMFDVVNDLLHPKKQAQIVGNDYKLNTKQLIELDIKKLNYNYTYRYVNMSEGKKKKLFATK